MNSANADLISVTGRPAMEKRRVRAVAPDRFTKRIGRSPAAILREHGSPLFFVRQLIVQTAGRVWRPVRVYL